MRMFGLLPRPLGSIFRKLTHLTCNSRLREAAARSRLPRLRSPLALRQESLLSLPCLGGYHWLQTEQLLRWHPVEDLTRDTSRAPPHPRRKTGRSKPRRGRRFCQPAVARRHRGIRGFCRPAVRQAIQTAAPAPSERLRGMASPRLSVLSVYSVVIPHEAEFRYPSDGILMPVGKISNGH